MAGLPRIPNAAGSLTVRGLAEQVSGGSKGPWVVGPHLSGILVLGRDWGAAETWRARREATAAVMSCILLDGLLSGMNFYAGNGEH